MKRIILIILFSLIFCSADSARVIKEGELELAIAHLLNYVSESGCTFIRNGKEYKAEKAANHMRRKYEHYKDEIETPEDFIRLAGTKSILSGRPYMVRTESGKEASCAEWLESALEEYRKFLTDGKEHDKQTADSIVTDKQPM
jgi:hypothetical protein